MRERMYQEARGYLRHNMAQLLPNWYAQSLGTLDSHRLYLIRAPHTREFVLSDAPAVAIRVTGDRVVTGLGSKAAPLSRDTEVVMPLGPSLCALLTPVARAPDASTSLVDWVNDVQSDRALRTIVCSPEAPHGVVDRVARRIVGRWRHDAGGLPLPPPASEDVPALTLVNV